MKMLFLILYFHFSNYYTSLADLLHVEYIYIRYFCFNVIKTDEVLEQYYRKVF